MERIIFRNDDVCSNTDFKKLEKIYAAIKEFIPDSRILSCVTIFSDRSPRGSVYDDVPFKDNPIKWFYGVDKAISRDEVKDEWLERVASHGLIHIDHSKVGKDAQELSILTSCKYLGTTQFVAPFNKYNEDTKEICQRNGIRLVNDRYEWKSLEHNEFNPNHKYWYFHSWKWDENSLGRKLYQGQQLAQ